MFIFVFIFAVLFYFLKVTLTSLFLIRVNHFYLWYYLQPYFTDILVALLFSHKFTSLKKIYTLSLLHIYKLLRQTLGVKHAKYLAKNTCQTLLVDINSSSYLRHTENTALVHITFLRIHFCIIK